MIAFECIEAAAGFDKILSILWEAAVKPVLEALEFELPASGKPLLRIIWCPTGPLSFLPMHAAVLYNQIEAGHKVTDYAVCSTVTTLLQDPPLSSSTFDSLLAASQPNTRSKNATSSGGWNGSMDPRPPSTKFALRSAKVIGSISPATQYNKHPTEALESAFCIYDGSREPSDIIQESHAHAEFAFLSSACQTSTGDQTLSAEAVHLAAGMQMAGYRSAVAMMWSIKDADGPTVAGNFYRRMFDGEGRTVRGRHRHCTTRSSSCARRRGPTLASATNGSCNGYRSYTLGYTW
ncbi:hypothetical protein EVG20_g3028 [Dentipellis fragilis]|uniref:CHAT domain-containing protein n=1 Tax=Dentipellis fragilis TaxID=205917 RepID=A0A4Y9Z551_9AGAM|nr:hypothetical protein EVG20_g3028 [Dentipellis fragilis]